MQTHRWALPRGHGIGCLWETGVERERPDPRVRHCLPLGFEKFWQKMMCCPGKLSTSSSESWRTPWVALRKAGSRAWRWWGWGTAPGVQTRMRFPPFPVTWTDTRRTGSPHPRAGRGSCRITTRPARLLVTSGAAGPWPCRSLIFGIR